MNTGPELADTYLVAAHDLLGKVDSLPAHSALVPAPAAKLAAPVLQQGRCLRLAVWRYVAAAEKTVHSYFKLSYNIVFLQWRSFKPTLLRKKCLIINDYIHTQLSWLWVISLTFLHKNVHGCFDYVSFWLNTKKNFPITGFWTKLKSKSNKKIST